MTQIFASAADFARRRAYRWLFAGLLGGPLYALFVFWFSSGTVSLATAYFYFTVIPLLFAAVLTGLLRDTADPLLRPSSLAAFALYSLVPYTIYDWARVPMNYFFGLPFWDHWYDWGASITGYPIFSFPSLATGLLTHAERGWGMAMAYYVLARKVTLPSAFVFAWAMTVFYWVFFPTFVLVDSRPPFIWWFTAWESHMVFAIGLWFSPRLFSYLSR